MSVSTLEPLTDALFNLSYGGENLRWIRGVKIARRNTTSTREP
jgi:hypothetical protein